MAEQRREVKTIQVLMMCDQCGGEMVNIDHNVRLTDPPQHRHECRSGCGNVQYYSKTYPQIEYAYIEAKFVTHDDMKKIFAGK